MFCTALRNSIGLFVGRYDFRVVSALRCFNVRMDQKTPNLFECSLKLFCGPTTIFQPQPGLFSPRFSLCRYSTIIDLVGVVSSVDILRVCRNSHLPLLIGQYFGNYAISEEAEARGAPSLIADTSAFLPILSIIRFYYNVKKTHIC